MQINVFLLTKLNYWEKSTLTTRWQELCCNHRHQETPTRQMTEKLYRSTIEFKLQMLFIIITNLWFSLQVLGLYQKMKNSSFITCTHSYTATHCQKSKSITLTSTITIPHNFLVCLLTSQLEIYMSIFFSSIRMVLFSFVVVLIF